MPKAKGGNSGSWRDLGEGTWGSSRPRGCAEICGTSSLEEGGGCQKTRKKKKKKKVFQAELQREA